MEKNKLSEIKKIILSNRLWKIITCLYALFLFCLNSYRINDNSFWSDECFTIKLSRLSIIDMLKATAADVHPPLYYILQIFLCRIFGEHPWTFRILPLIPFLITMIFVLTVVWDKFGKEASILMLTFCGVLPYSVRYNAEARMYSLAFMFVLFAYYSLRMIFEDSENKKGYIYLTVFSLGAAYSHYYAMMTVAFLYLAALIFALVNHKSVKKVLLTYIITIVGYLPWLFQMVSTYRRTAGDYWMTDYPSLKDSFESFFHITSWYSWGMLILTLVLLVIFLVKNKWTVDSVWMIWGVIMSFGLVLVGEAISYFIRPAFSLRYIFPAMCSIWLVCCVLIASLKPVFKYILTIAVFGLTFVLGMMIFRFGYYTREARYPLFEETYKNMQECFEDDDILVTNYFHYNLTLLDYYFPNNEHFLVEDGIFEPESGKDYWFVCCGDDLDACKENLSKYGYSMQEEIHDGDLGGYPLHLYRVIKD